MIRLIDQQFLVPWRCLIRPRQRTAAGVARLLSKPDAEQRLCAVRAQNRVTATLYEVREEICRLLLTGKETRKSAVRSSERFLGNTDELRNPRIMPHFSRLPTLHGGQHEIAGWRSLATWIAERLHTGYTATP